MLESRQQKEGFDVERRVSYRGTGLRNGMAVGGNDICHQNRGFKFEGE